MRAATASPDADGLAGSAGEAEAWKAATTPSPIGLSFSSVTMGPGDGGLVAALGGGGELCGGQDVEHGQRRLRPDALDGFQHHEGPALIAVEEAVEGHSRLLPPLAFDLQGGGLARAGQASERARAAAHHIADAGHVDQRLFLADLGHDAPKPADHEAVSRSPARPAPLRGSVGRG